MRLESNLEVNRDVRALARLGEENNGKTARVSGQRRKLRKGESCRTSKWTSISVFQKGTSAHSTMSVVLSAQE
eukprot:COSAG04_NODE_1747_length_5715_cov_2.362536_3_plen_73_part_00